MVERRRERERFAGGGISFGVALALWRWVERRARSAARWRESLGGALVVASVAAFIAGDAWVRPAPGSTLAATIRMPVAIAASETEPAGAPRASIGTLVFDSTAPAQSTVTPARSTAAPAQSTAARGEPSSSASPAQVVPVGRGQAPEASASTDPPAAAVSSRRQAARAHMVRARAALHQEKNIAKARALIEMYEAAFPEDPFPDQHAALRAALNEP